MNVKILLKLRKALIAGAVFSLSMLLPQFLNAQTAGQLTIAAGTSMNTAGELKEEYLDKVFVLNEHIPAKKKVYIKLPLLKEGQGFHLEAVNTQENPYLKNGVITMKAGSGTRGTYAVVSVDTKEQCKFDFEVQPKAGEKRTCRTGSVSSEKESYQYYLEVTGFHLNGPTELTNKDVNLKISRFNRYDQAVEEGDVTDKIKNALAIESGQYAGWLSNNDAFDQYKIDGLSKGAVLKVTASQEADDEYIEFTKIPTKPVVIVKLYDASKKEIYQKKMELRKYDEEGSLELSIGDAKGGPAKKETRYIEVGMKCAGGICFNATSTHYSLNVEVEGNVGEFSSGGRATNCSGFQDVVSSDKRCSAVKFIKQKGIMNGVNGTRFEGSRHLGRAELAAVMLTFIGESPLDNDDLGTLTAYKDIAEKDRGDWSVGVLKKALELEIIKGFPDGTLRPLDPVSRSQFAVNFTKVKGITPPSVTRSPAKDVKANSRSTASYRAAVKYMLDNNLMSVDASGKFNPNASITRFEVAQAIHGWFLNNQ